MLRLWSRNITKLHVAASAPHIMNRLRDIVVTGWRHLPVHFITNDEMKRITGNPSVGAFSLTGGPDGGPVILLNTERMTTETPLHEAFHGATELAMQRNPIWRALMERLRVEVLKNMPGLTNAERTQIGYYLTQNYKEFLNGMMTNAKMQELLKGVKISEQLACAISISRYGAG